MVLFFESWCKHSKKALEKWPEMAKAAIENHDSSVKFATFDAFKYSMDKMKYDITKVPQVKLIKGKWIFDYRGERDEEAIFRWLRRMSGQVFGNTPCAELKERVKHSHTLVYFGPSDHSMAKMFTDEAIKQENRVLILKSEDQECAKELGVTSWPAIAFFSEYE